MHSVSKIVNVTQDFSNLLNKNTIVVFCFLFFFSNITAAQHWIGTANLFGSEQQLNWRVTQFHSTAKFPASTRQEKCHFSQPEDARTVTTGQTLEGVFLCNAAIKHMIQQASYPTEDWQLQFVKAHMFPWNTSASAHTHFLTASSLLKHS